MCVYYRGYCTNNRAVCVDGSEYVDKRASISANIAIDDVKNNIHIIIDGDIKDIEKFGQNLFDGVQKYIKDYMKVEYSDTAY